MCGICGFLTNHNVNNQEVMASMQSAIAHRGREACKSWHDDFIWLGHNRLSLHDMKARADQPMISGNNRYVIVFNGEIYNYLELAQEYSLQLKTASDSEVLLELWSLMQADCLNKLNGMFAFAIYDKETKTISCGRDRLGVKPFYYYQNDEIFIFASEAKAILRHPLYHKELNREALSDYLSYGYITGEKTIYNGIKKLTPASFITISSQETNIKYYWNIADAIRSRAKTSKEEILDLLRSSIKLRQAGEISVDSFLSSGIDSTAITKLAFQNNSDIQTYTLGFDDKCHDESAVAKAFAESEGIKNKVIQLASPNVECLENIVEFFDQPFFDSSTLPFFQLCQAAAKSGKAFMTGDGGDEIFAGYETRKADLACLIGHKLPGFSSISQLISSIFEYIPANKGKVSLNYKLRQFFAFAGLSQQEAHYSWRLLFTEDEKKKLLNEEINKSLIDRQYQSWSNFHKIFEKYKNLPILQRQAIVDLETWLSDDILYKSDQCSMANTIEIRSPFLDYRLVEAAFTIPEKTKFDLFTGKKLLRNTLKDILPANILNRKKEGFGSPIANWLENQLKEPFFDIISSNSFKKLVSNTKEIENIYTEQLQRKRDNSYRLWAILMLALWQKRWM